MVQLFRTCSEDQLNQEIISSFSSIHTTFLHLWAVEIVWMDRLQSVPNPRFPSNGFSGSTEDVFEHILQSSQALVDFIQNKPAAFFESPIEFTLLTAPGTNQMLPADMLHHLFNHQTMHRGQLITMGRQLGITAFPRTDYIMWLREQKDR
jgi:uncharacterized damage-inducible protein DinB